jgi:hypothetical protein
MKKVLFTLQFVILAGLTNAEIPNVNQSGVGTRAFGLGNNYVALSNDYSAVYWNPAGLAFLPVREIHIGFENGQMNKETEFSGLQTTRKRNDFNVSSLGLVHSIPTSRGGFSFALGYSRPTSLNDMLYLSGTDVYKGDVSRTIDDTIVYLQKGDTIYYDFLKRSANGHFSLWSVAAGWQVAENFGFGITASYIGGDQHVESSDRSRTNKYAIGDGGNYGYDVDYRGIDLRIGGIYHLNKIVTMGARINLYQNINYYLTSEYFKHATGSLNSSMSGALGIGLTLPGAIFTGDFNFSAPNSNVDEGNLSYWRLGGGVGAELPVKAISSILRIGYHWDELEPYPFVDYLDNTYQKNDFILENKSSKQLFTGGMSLLLNEKMTIDVAYGYSIYSFTTQWYDWQNTLQESYKNHRGAVTISVRY